MWYKSLARFVSTTLVRPSPECHWTRQTVCHQAARGWSWQKWAFRGCRWHGRARCRYPGCPRPPGSSGSPLSPLQPAPTLPARPRQQTPWCQSRGLWGPSSGLWWWWSREELDWQGWSLVSIWRYLKHLETSSTKSTCFMTGKATLNCRILIWSLTWRSGQAQERKWQRHINKEHVQHLRGLSG